MRVLEEVGTVNYPRDSNENAVDATRTLAYRKSNTARKTTLLIAITALATAGRLFAFVALTRNGFSNEIETKHYGQKDE
ncbi:MAG: hypothetical protein CM1200mP25_2660 [Acidobacteriota bacterium]|nr:MAG: hypothetical protein CM1200mP25_2660 [Acidobacteriota bacterium]